MATIRDFVTWLQELDKFGRADDSIELIDDLAEIEGGGRQLSVKLYTANNAFQITAVEHDGDRPNYLGCTSSARRPRAGEHWHRGSDLADGPLEFETWHRIVCQIVSYEKIKVVMNSLGDHGGLESRADVNRVFVPDREPRGLPSLKVPEGAVNAIIGPRKPLMPEAATESPTATRGQS